MSLVDTNNLSRILSAQTGVAEEDVAKFLQSFASVIASHVSNGEEVEILGLGKFIVIDTSQTSMRRVALMMSEALKAEVNSPFSFFEPYIINKGSGIVKEVEKSVIIDETESSEQTIVQTESLGQNDAENEPEPESSDSKTMTPSSNDKKQKMQYLGCLFSIVVTILIIGIWYYLLSNKTKVKPIDSVAALSFDMADSTKTTDIAVDDEEPVKDEQSTVIEPESTAKTTETTLVEKTIVEKPKVEKEAADKAIEEEIVVKPVVDGVSDIQIDSLGKPLTTVINSGERLTLISLKYFGSKDFWPYIYWVNREKLKSPNNVVVGTVLNLPNSEYFGIDSENEESLAKARQLGHSILRK